MTFLDNNLNEIKEIVCSGGRLDFNHGMILYKSHDLIGIGKLANYIKNQRHGKKAYYIYNQHLNYTNICKNKCLFCAFGKTEKSDGAYAYSINDIKKMLTETGNNKIRELHIVGGLNPTLGFDYFTGMLETAKKIRPNATIKAFTAVEIDYLSKLTGFSIKETIETLKKSGLMMMPGGGAEIMSDRVRYKLFPKKVGKDRWMEIMEVVHQAGIKTNATMLYGHIESLEERVQHLVDLRNLQDKTGGFLAFIPLAFQSKHTKLSYLPETTGFDDLKNIAVSRLMLDNFDHIKAYWVMIGEKLAQVALHFGADDLDGTIIEERIGHEAGADSAKGLTVDEILRLIRSSGLEPVERDSFYNPIINNVKNKLDGQ